MKKQDITTSRLDDILKSVKSDKDIREYLDKYTNVQYSTFAEYFNSYVIDRKLSLTEIIEKSNISRNYFYNILNGDRNPGRDKIIALCIGAGMDVKETNRALKIAKEGILYSKDKRDALIIISIHDSINSITELNIILDEAGLPLLK